MLTTRFGRTEIPFSLPSRSYAHCIEFIFVKYDLHMPPGYVDTDLEARCSERGNRTQKEVIATPLRFEVNICQFFETSHDHV